jgi:hypothetical protein
MPREILAYSLARQVIAEKDIPALLDRVFRGNRYCPAPGSEEDSFCSMLADRGYLFRDPLMGGYARV